MGTHGRHGVDRVILGSVELPSGVHVEIKV